MRAEHRPGASSYRALHPRSLMIQLALLLVVEVLLFLSYSVHDARFHWATHFLVAVIVAIIVMAIYLRVRKAPGPRFLLMLVLGLHVFAMAPDLLFRAGVPHAAWMDIFLGHVSAHYMPGGDTTWLVIAVTAITGYVVALTRWLRSQAPEADTIDRGGVDR